MNGGGVERILCCGKECMSTPAAARVRALRGAIKASCNTDAEAPT